MWEKMEKQRKKEKERGGEMERDGGNGERNSL